jgi:hypothetical protein
VSRLEHLGHGAVHADCSGGRFETLDVHVPELVAHELGQISADRSAASRSLQIVTTKTVPSPALSTPASIAW